MQNAVIEFSNISKTYRMPMAGKSVAALSRLSFRVEPGEVCGFLGPNGAGKTTAFSILMGFLAPDSGRVTVLGNLAGDVRARRQIGFLPENFAFYPYLTARKLLGFHFALAGIGNPPPGTIERLIEEVNLTSYEGLPIGKYSRGMKQRIGMAQALVGDPQLLVLDEPTSGLDPASRHEVLDLIVRLKRMGKTILLSSHILPEVEMIADRIVVVDHGRLLHDGSLADMLDTGNRVEMTVEDLPEEVGSLLAERGAVVDRSSAGIRIVVDNTLKREIADTLWNAGCDVVSMNPVRTSLEGQFLKLLSPKEEKIEDTSHSVKHVR